MPVKLREAVLAVCNIEADDGMRFDAPHSAPSRLTFTIHFSKDKP